MNVAEKIQPKVSVIVTTFNHERFIRRCIDSVLAQQASFDFDVIISEDCSTDGTRKIISDYADYNPDKIRLLLSTRNINSNIVTRRAIEASQAKYVSLIDGDDYCTSVHKLQKQVDFLDANAECALCFHSIIVVDEFENLIRPAWIIGPARSELEDLIVVGNFVPGSSPMMRRAGISKLPEWFDNPEVYGDWALCLIGAQSGQIGYLEDCLSAYRQHPGGFWSSQDPAQQFAGTIECLRIFEKFLDPIYLKIIINRRAELTNELLSCEVPCWSWGRR